jgi:hypothetical protein
MVHPQNGSSLPRLSDEELEYYGDLYLYHGIRESNVDFETFVSNPEYFLQKYARGQRRADGGKGQRRRGLREYLRLQQSTRTAPE